MHIRTRAITALTVLALASPVLLVVLPRSTPRSAPATERTYWLFHDVRVPIPAPEQRLPDTTVTTIPPLVFTGPRMLAARVKLAYLVTPRSDHYQHGFALRVRIDCLATDTGRLFAGPYASHNFVWQSANPPGPDVVLATRALFDPPGASADNPESMRCRLVASTGISPEPALYGEPVVQILGARRHSPTFVRAYPDYSPASTTWKQPGIVYIASGRQPVLRQGFTASRGARWLFFAADLELTTCDHNTAVCPSSEWGAPGVRGTDVRTQLTAQRVPTHGCASTSASSAMAPAATYISNFVHHTDLAEQLWVKAPPAGCRLSFSAQITVVSGNPLRVETGSQTRAILIVTSRPPCLQDGKPVAKPNTC